MNARTLPVLFLIGLALGGCGKPDPASSKLGPGEVMVVAVSPCYFDIGPPGGPVTTLGAGVRLMVGVDPGIYVETEATMEVRMRHESPAEAEAIRKRGPIRAKMGEPSSGLRQIEVTVQDGPHAGESGTVHRMDLRPIP